MKSQVPTTDWRLSLLLTLGVVLTVIIALLMAPLDRLQIRRPIVPSPVSVGILIGTATPALVPLPTASALSPTATTNATPGVTAVAVLPRCQIPSGWVSYTVRRGDTLSYLAARSGATVAQIVQANCLDPNMLLAGMIIYLPAQPPARPPCGPPSHWVRYTVKPGDTKYSLALQRGTTVYAIDHANCHRRLLANTKIYLPPLPATAIPSATATAIATATPTATTTATVIATATATPTISTTPTASAATPTQTATMFPTAPPSATATADVTATPPPVPSATATAAATATATPTASAATPTATPASPPTTTPTAKPGNTPTATASPLPSSTLVVATPNPTGTLTSTTIAP